MTARPTLSRVPEADHGEAPLPRLAAVAVHARRLLDRAIEHQLARRLDKAEAEYRRVLRVDPLDIEAHSNLGAILCQRGRIEEAQKHFRCALEAQPRIRAGFGLRSVA